MLELGPRPDPLVGDPLGTGKYGATAVISVGHQPPVEVVIVPEIMAVSNFPI